MKHAAKAIIYENDQYLLQLRDDKVSIPYPNCWSFFGGEIETGETPWQALQRELMEEINWCTDEKTFLYKWIDQKVQCIVYFFILKFSGNKNELSLNEGEKMCWFTIGEVKLIPNTTPLIADHLLESQGLFCKEKIIIYTNI